MTPEEFVAEWQNTSLKERQSYQIHFNNLCDLVGYERPSAKGQDKQGNQFVFEQYGLGGFADVWLQGHFAIEYKAPQKFRQHKDLSDAYNQLLRYREQVFNPPLLVVTDIDTWEIHTNFVGVEHKIYTFTHAEIATEPRVMRWLTALFKSPEQLHPQRNTEAVTLDAALGFQHMVDNMRQWEAEPERIAKFLTKIVFCLFADGIGLLPSPPNSPRGVFSEIVHLFRTQPDRFTHYTQQLFQAMNDGGDVLAANIPYFNGSLFADVVVEKLQLEALEKLRSAADKNWASIEPAVFGTLFERVLDKSKRAQLGAHYTSRADILLITEPVLMQPLRREWESLRASAAAMRTRLEASRTLRDIDDVENVLRGIRSKMLTRLRTITVLDPACGSGNFLYVALQSLMDLEKAVINDPSFKGLEPAELPAVHPRQMYGIEKDTVAHALAGIAIWIGYIQWRANNGYADLFDRPILKNIGENIVCKDAILTFDPSPTNPTPNPSPLRKEGSLEWREGLNIRPSAEIWEQLKPFAREMRKNPTPAEDHLWQQLRRKQMNTYRFRRQHAIDRFIVDFYCAAAQLIVEVDGSIHDEPDQREYDLLRQEALESLGFRVLRVRNDEVLNETEHVLTTIREALNNPTPSPSLLRKEGSEEAVEAPQPRSGEGLGRGVEPDWPTVDVIIGNPPFLGGSKLRGELGAAYYKSLTKLYKDRVPGGADLVTYWFEKARAHIESGKAKRVGLISTNSIRGGANREVLKRIKQSGDIFLAHADHEWTLEGAAVRVSMVGFDNGDEKERKFFGPSAPIPRLVQSIKPDLTSGVDITVAKVLEETKGICFRTDEKGGPFDIGQETAKQMLKDDPKNSEVIRPYINGLDITRGVRDMWIIDFGTDVTEEYASRFSAPYNYVKSTVKPVRDLVRNEKEKTQWWLHRRPAPDMRKAVLPLKRYIATPSVAKHRLFVWMDKSVLPDHQLYAITRDDDYFFGVLHSKIHEIWSLRMGTWLGKGNDPRYTPTTTFETFPFPYIPGKEPLKDPCYKAIAEAARQLHLQRDQWLKHGIGKAKDRTLTNLYNALNVLRGKESMKTVAAAGDFVYRLDALHQTLDKAVCAAYGWDASLLADDEAILAKLLDLNLSRGTMA